MSKFSHDADAAQLRQQISTFSKPWYRSCSDVLDKEKLYGGRCLDLCSGNCEYSQILRDKYQMEVVCADYIPLHLQQAVQAGFPTLEINLDADDLEIDKAVTDHIGTFDLVVNLAAVEHVFCSDNLMRVAHNLLKPAGHFLINTPNIGFLAYRIYSALNGNRPYGEGHHIRFWDYRFLQTCLFFNGFSVVDDCRRFFSLPEEILQRAFRNNIFLSKLIAKFFYSCFLWQHIPFCRGWSTDELTVLCRKEAVVPIPFDYLVLKNKLEYDKQEGGLDKKAVLQRLSDAKERGWLKEHIYMSRLVDEYSR